MGGPVIELDEAEFELRLVRTRPRSGWPRGVPFEKNAVHAIVTARAHGAEGRAGLSLDGQWEDLDEVAFSRLHEQEFENLRAEALADLQSRIAR